METIKYYIIERRFSGNVLARDDKYINENGKDTIVQVKILHSFNKKFDHHLNELCRQLNNNLELIKTL